ncbi:MAG TPA: hypothetical protein VGB56_00005, partial [Flavisolibacter sp.]
MRTFLKLAGLFGLLIWCAIGQAQNISNKGKEFWVGYGHHQFMETGSNTQNMTIYLSAETQAAVVKVTIDSSSGLANPNTWWSRTYNVPAGQVISIETATATSSTGTGTGLTGAIPKGFPVDARLYN